MTDTSTVQMRRWWRASRCTYGTSGQLWARKPVYAQEQEWLRALEYAHGAGGYVNTPDGYVGSKRNCPAGIGGKDCQGDGTDCSLHNYGLAWDIEYQFNPHLRRKLTEADLARLFREGKTRYNPDIVATILAVKTTQGHQAFRWLGYAIGDLMHWQYNRPPSDRLIDWDSIGGGNYVPPPAQSGGIVYLPLVYSDGFGSNPDRKPDVEWLQLALHRAGFGGIIGTVDGAYGQKTADAVKRLTAGGDGRTFAAVQMDDLLLRAYQGEGGAPVAPHTHKYSGTTTEAP